MCGIFAVVNGESVSDTLTLGLSRLAYRGYDSAGIAMLTNGEIDRRRSEGEISNLEALLQDQPLRGRTGIGHTRWATHGRAIVRNAHPHMSERVAVVHNGIIENFQQLRVELETEGKDFSSDTDSEVIPHLISSELAKGSTPVDALEAAIERLEGSFAVAVLFGGHDDLVLAARRGSPLAVGYSSNRACLSSDANALVGMVDKAIHLNDDDIVALTAEGLVFRTRGGGKEPRLTQELSGDTAMHSRRGFAHHTLKEIHEQPGVLRRILRQLRTTSDLRRLSEQTGFDASNISEICMVACGTSRYASQIAAHWFESLAELPVQVKIASEFSPGSSTDNKLYLFISQSGETADTLSAMRKVKLAGGRTFALVNVESSSMAREADHHLLLDAGPEIGVASTKAFSAQLAWLGTLALTASQQRSVLADSDIDSHLQQLALVPGKIDDYLSAGIPLDGVVDCIVPATSALFLGRGALSALAAEAALKLTELSYCHGQGFPAGELKHGPLALIQKGTPVLLSMPTDSTFVKNRSSMEEVRARGACAVVLTDTEGAAKLRGACEHIIELPEVASLWAPLLYAVPFQLIAYQSGVAKGNNVDRPRNLAKSVTVE